MQIEGQAIDLIIGLEPKLCRTPDGTPGFDLYETDSSGRQVRWVEVKSMTGSLENRPVGLSHTQFEYAREKSDAYWLYVVEHATDPAQARVLRIQNPVAHARTFTFDRGWAEIAQTKRQPESVAAKPSNMHGLTEIAAKGARDRSNNVSNFCYTGHSNKPTRPTAKAEELPFQ